MGRKYVIEGAVLNMNNEKVWSHDFEEITLAIALLGGIIAVLLKINDYFNNNVIPSDSDLPGIASAVVAALLIELLTHLTQKA